MSRGQFLSFSNEYGSSCWAKPAFPLTAIVNPLPNLFCAPRVAESYETFETSSTPTKFWELHPALVPPQGGCCGRAGVEQVLPRLLGSPSALLEALVGRVHQHQREGRLVSTHEASRQATPPWWSLKQQLTSFCFWFWQRKLAPKLIWFCLLQANQANSRSQFLANIS